MGYTLWPINFELMDPGPFLDEAESLGVDSVEVPFFCTRLVGNMRIVEPAMRRFESHFRDRPFGVTCHGMLSINLMDEAERLPLHEAMARINIELAARLGSKKLVIHCGLSDEHGSRGLEAAYARQRESLARIGDHAARHGVEICVETIWSFDGRATALPSRLARELREIGHPAVSATLDFAHAALQCSLVGGNLMEEVHAIAPVTRHLHINDCYGVERDLTMALPAEEMAFGSGDLHLPIGWGSLDWDRLLTEPDWPSTEIILNQELHPTFWHALPDDVAALRRLSKSMLRVNDLAAGAVR